MFSTYEVNVPQINADVDRVKAKEHGIALTDVFETLQVYLGSLYVNDFNRFGRTYQVIAQADAPFRAKAEDILRLKTRNEAGEMVPLGSVVRSSQTLRPGSRDPLQRLSCRRDQRRARARLLSTGQAQAAMERILARDAAERREVRVDRAHLPGDLAGNSACSCSRCACCSSSWCSPR